MHQTQLLKSVLEILSENKKPISVSTILELLREKSLTPNKSTLYRMLEKLNKRDEISVLHLDDKNKYYKLKSHQHHHFKCDSCDEIQCVTDQGLEKQIQNLQQKLAQQGMNVSSHHFSLSGTCSDCR